MTRVYHPYTMWEDFKAGFYDNISGKTKEEMKVKVIELFSSKELTEKYMQMVIDKWVYSCEHNLTNPSLNKIAYIGQSACCIFCGASSSITMEAWHLVSKENRAHADLIAQSIIDKWTLINKNKQLCLKLD